jgi:hypothetical protein
MPGLNLDGQLRRAIPRVNRHVELLVGAERLQTISGCLTDVPPAAGKESATERPIGSSLHLGEDLKPVGRTIPAIHGQTLNLSLYPAYSMRDGRGPADTCPPPNARVTSEDPFTLHDDPVRIALELVDEFRGVDGPAFGGGREVSRAEGRQTRVRWPGWRAVRFELLPIRSDAAGSVPTRLSTLTNSGSPSNSAHRLKFDSVCTACGGSSIVTVTMPEPNGLPGVASTETVADQGFLPLAPRRSWATH